MTSRQLNIVVFGPGSPFEMGFLIPLVIDDQHYESVLHYLVSKKLEVLRPSDPVVTVGLSSDDLRVISKSAWDKAGSNERAAWETVARDVAMRGNLAKFSDDLKLRAQLMLTDEAILVYARANDLFWSVGLDENHPDVANPLAWIGKNGLGNGLTALRQHLAVLGHRASKPEANATISIS